MDTSEATARRVIAGLTVFVVVAVVVVLYAIPRPRALAGSGPDTLATVNALLNGGCAVFLLLGYVAIRSKRVAIHRFCMCTSFVLSSVFLVTYLAHHARVGSVPYRGSGTARALYFAVLVPHVVLATVIVPMALVTIYRGVTSRIPAHRYIARRTLPIWLYVSASGVLIYFMLYH